MTREQIAKLGPLELLRLAQEENPDKEQAYLRAISSLLVTGHIQAARHMMDECLMVYGDPSAPMPVGILSYSGVAENEIVIVDENGEVLGKIVGGE